MKAVCKKLFSLMLVAILLVSAVPFQVSAEEINIGISVREGNKVLKDAMDAVLSPMNADSFNALLAQAVAIQPIEE